MNYWIRKEKFICLIIIGMNTKIDNYVDSISKWDVIEFEWDNFEFIRIVEDLIICDNWHVFTTSEFNDDLEFWDNSIYKKYLLKKWLWA